MWVVVWDGVESTTNLRPIHIGSCYSLYSSVLNLFIIYREENLLNKQWSPLNAVKINAGKPLLMI